MNTLPVEILHLIAKEGVDVYRPLLGIPAFARDLTPSTKTDYMIIFGYEITITRNYIRWMRTGTYHRIGAPAYVFIYGKHPLLVIELQKPQYIDPYKPISYKSWYANDRRHRLHGPAIEVISNDIEYREWWVDGKCTKIEVSRVDDGVPDIISVIMLL